MAVEGIGAMKISDHIYLYLWDQPRENNCNSVLIDGKTPLLIDPGHLHRVPHLFERIRADGFDPEKIKAVICTHGHPDHFEGTLAFEKAPVKIGVSMREERYIEEVGRSVYMEQGMTMPDFRVDFHLREGTLNVGRHEFEVILTPGHSPGGLCLYWPRYRVLITGDTVFARGVGRTDLPGGNGEELSKSIDRLSKLRTEVLLPGHGPAIQGEKDVQANFAFVKQAFTRSLG
jgi:glyoxylase-like metal-dependent hydrolase (beta-lactamase superfamily II)